MSILLAIAVIAIILIVAINMGKGTKAEDGSFTLRALSMQNGEVPIILEKSKIQQQGCVIIPSGVTTIGYEVFLGMNQITDVKIHEKVKIIGQRSFKDCTGLQMLYVGEGTEKIGDEAFIGCTGLKKVIIGPRVKEIQSNAFKNCNCIETIEIEGYNTPDIFSTTFEESVRRNCVVFVHNGCRELFFKAPGWDGFSNIKEI